MLAVQCDANGNPYVKTVGTDGLEILGFTAKGAITFSISQMTDVPEPSVESLSVGSSGIYLLVDGLENARKEERKGAGIETSGNERRTSKLYRPL